MSALLEARDLTCRFGTTTAVQNLTLQVHPGEVVGLVGANGAGKTTTMRMLLGLQRPTSGTALLEGGPPDRDARTRLGYVPQGLGLYAELTVSENLAFSAQAYGCPVAALPPSLVGVADRLVGGLPLGLRRQVAFLCAVQHGPAVLVLDEPTSGVDALGRARLWDAIRERAQDGAGVLVSTHYMDEARQCDRLLLMAEGRLVAGGSEADIVGDTTAVSVIAADWARAFDVLHRAGLPVTLAGRAVRVVDRDPGEVRTLLGAAGVEAGVEVARATLEERMTVLAPPP
jgi:ABC-2 type transport system ATP-binding protein/ribosome-dependent ATPase